MSIHYKITGDNEDFKRKMRENSRIIRDGANEADKVSSGINRSVKAIGAATVAAFSAQAIKGFINEISRVRSEFQQLEIAFTTMLGSKEKADALMRQAINTAAKTPFDLNQVATGYKQLLAYGIGAEKLNDTLVTLGDVASGVGAPLNDIVYLYGTLNASGRVALMDIRQFAGRGIPIYEELAKVLGIAKEQVNDFASAGKISFEHVELAFKNMTSEGGRFANLMEKQSASIGGLKANLGDAVDMMKNELGQKLQPLFEESLQAQVYMVENYEEIGKTIMGLVAAYGTYRAVLISISAVEKINMQVARQAVLQRQLAAALDMKISNAEAISLARTRVLTLAKQGLGKTLKSLATALTPNPYVLAAAAVAGLTFAVYKLATAEKASETAVRAAAKAQEERIQAIDNERTSVEQLLNKLKDETLTRRERQSILNKLQQKYPDILKNLDLEKVKYMDLADIIRQINGLIEQKTKLQIQDDISNAQSIASRLSGTLGQGGYVSAEQSSLSKQASDLLGLNFWQKMTTSTTEMLDGLGTYIRERQSQLQKINDEEFQALSNEEKRNKLLAERNAIYKQYNISEGTRPDLIPEEAESQLRKINQQIEEYGKTTATVVSKNKAYWEEEKKNAEEALGLLTSENTVKEWADARAKVAKAQAELSKYSTSTGGSKTEQTKKDNYIFDVQREDGIKKIQEDVKAFFDARRKANLEGVKAERQAEEEARVEYLIQWGNFEQKRIALIDKYELEASKAKTKAEKDGLLKLLNQSLQDLTSEQLKKGGLFEKMFGDVERLSTDTLNDILGVDEYIDKLGLSVEETKIFKDAILNARKELENRNPFTLLTNSWNDFVKAIKSNPDAAQDALKRLEKGVADTISYLSDVGSSVGSIFSSFGNDRVGEDINNIIGIVGGVGQAGVGIGKLASGDIIGGVKDLAKGISEAVGGIVRMNDAVKEREIERLQNQIDALDKSYQSLGDAIEKSYSKDASKMIEQQNVLLKQQQTALRQQIAQEEAKKKTDKNRIKQWKDELAEIDKLISDNKEKAIDAIFGEDVQSAISNFADAYVRAIGAGEDKMKSMKDVAKKMIQGVIAEMVKADLEPTVKNLRDKINYYLTDGIIDAYEQEQLDRLIEQATDNLDKEYGWADKYLKGSETQGAATYGAYEKITQDQADRIDGRLTGMHMIMIENSGTFRSMDKNLNETRGLSLLMLEELQGINKNTKLINQTNEKLDKIIKNTESL